MKRITDFIITFLEGYFIVWYYAIVVIIVASLAITLFTWTFPLALIKSLVINIIFFKVVNGVGIIAGIVKTLEL